jgi:hypothetical protein
VDLVRNDRVFPLLKPDLRPSGVHPLQKIVDGNCHFDSDGFCLFASKFG